MHYMQLQYMGQDPTARIGSREQREGKMRPWPWKSEE